MSDTIKICVKQEECPLLLAAFEAKVKAESELRLWDSCCNPQQEISDLKARMAKMSASGKRLYTLVKACRDAQKNYFAASKDDDKKSLLKASRAAEIALGKLLSAYAVALASRGQYIHLDRPLKHIRARSLPGAYFCIKQPTIAIFSGVDCIKPASAVQKLISPFIYGLSRAFPPVPALYQTTRHLTPHRNLRFIGWSNGRYRLSASGSS